MSIYYDRLFLAVFLFWIFSYSYHEIKINSLRIALALDKYRAVCNLFYNSALLGVESIYYTFLIYKSLGKL